MSQTNYTAADLVARRVGESREARHLRTVTEDIRDAVAAGFFWDTAQVAAANGTFTVQTGDRGTYRVSVERIA
jgi:hypothetical protein